MGMQLRHCVAGLVLVAVSLVSAPSGSQSPPVERITGDDGRYSIEMPAGYTSKVSPRPDGGAMRTLTYLWKNGSDQYNVIALAVVDPPPGSVRPIDLWEAQRQLQARYPGTFIGQAREIELGRAKGVEFSFTVNSNRNQGPHTIACRIYALDGRLYEMLAATRAEDRDDPVVTAFMNSLRINR